jgi:hypothetical protein
LTFIERNWDLDPLTDRSRDNLPDPGDRARSRLSPVTKDANDGPYIQHELVRIYMLFGENEKALDKLEPLLKIPYDLSRGWFAIDPNFDPLRKERRFQNLVAGAK